MKRAFTRIELVVVIAMIAGLVGMVTPALEKARDEANKAKCASNVHSLGLAWAMFRKDYNGEWTREPCGPQKYAPESIAELAVLGYVPELDVYMCPVLDTPFSRDPSPIMGYGGRSGPWPTGEMEGITYFADEARIPRQPLPLRAVLADGIEMVTRYGKEPANHADDRGRAVGANVLFADMAVQWTGVYRPEHTWVMDRHGVDGPRGIGFTAAEDWYPHVTGGTWRRYGYIQNTRLLNRDPDEKLEWGGSGVGEDDIDNSHAAYIAAYGTQSSVTRPFDVDDIYYEECDTATYGEEHGRECEWGFVAKARGARCCQLSDRDERDCSLAGGHLWWWRGGYANTRVVPAAYEGIEGWGWPDELSDDAQVEGGNSWGCELKW